MRNALMLYLTEFSTALKRLSLNNPTQGIWGRDWIGATLISAVWGRVAPASPASRRDAISTILIIRYMRAMRK